MNRPLRILFASTHSYVDPGSGAALTTRDVLEQLAARGHDCRVLAAGVLDSEPEAPLGSLLARLGLPARPLRAALPGGESASVFDMMLAGVRGTLLPTGSSRADRAPAPGESRAFLALAEQAFARFRPDVVLTYGGHPVIRALMGAARARGIPIAFHLHNFAYAGAAFFADATALLVPSEFARHHYAALLGRDATVLPPPLVRERVVATDPAPRFLTFVNPTPAKGAVVVARIALELNRRRPEIPLLVVEGRAGVGALLRAGLDMTRLANLHRMTSTPDPRAFYRVSRAVLMPSLGAESFGRLPPVRAARAHLLDDQPDVPARRERAGERRGGAADAVRPGQSGGHRPERLRDPLAHLTPFAPRLEPASCSPRSGGNGPRLLSPIAVLPYEDRQPIGSAERIQADLPEGHPSPQPGQTRPSGWSQATSLS